MAESMLQTSSAFSCEILQFGNMGIGRIFFRWGPLGYFSKIFPKFFQGCQKWWNLFFLLKTKKTTFFAQIFKIQRGQGPRGVHLLPKELRFEHVGAKLTSCAGCHLTLLRPCKAPNCPPSSDAHVWEAYLCELISRTSLQSSSLTPLML